MGYLGNDGSMQHLLFDQGATPSEPALVTRRLNTAGSQPVDGHQASIGSSAPDPARPASSDDVALTDRSNSNSANPATALYVATNLDNWETSATDRLANDLAIEGRAFRRLDPLFWAWLLHKFGQARQAAEQGTIPANGFETLRSRWARVHSWAAEHLDENDLRRAVRQLAEGLLYVPPGARKADDRSNVPSAPRTSKPSLPALAAHSLGEGPFVQPVTAESLAAVHAIHEKAIDLGWTDEGLLRNRGRFRFPCGEDYGLVCFLGSEDRIGEVTREAIEIVGRDGRSGKRNFYNREIERPWVRSRVLLAQAA